ncbi:MAG: hypothetical protein Ta2E_09560 [Mycoplasmoidaceae bacterium]|nr:MAG: hypothetical protein Ta2E_09560 [Mycoplasmoidaceae bacterium]
MLFRTNSIYINMPAIKQVILRKAYKTFREEGVLFRKIKNFPKVFHRIGSKEKQYALLQSVLLGHNSCLKIEYLKVTKTPIPPDLKHDAWFPISPLAEEVYIYGKRHIIDDDYILDATKSKNEGERLGKINQIYVMWDLKLIRYDTQRGQILNGIAENRKKYIELAIEKGAVSKQELTEAQITENHTIRLLGGEIPL